MNVTADLTELRRVLRTVKPATANRSLPALAGVLIEATDNAANGVTATTTDLGVRITVNVDEDRIGQTGRCLVPFDRLSRLIGGMGDGPCTLSHADRLLTIESGAVTAELHTLADDQFPNARPLEDGRDWKLGDDWQAVQRVLHARSLDEARPGLTSVRLAGGFAVCTDSYRLARHRIANDCDLTLPPGPIVAAAGSCPDGEITLRAGVTTWELEADGTVWQAGLAVAEFPELSSITGYFDKRLPLSFRVDREELLDAVRLVEVVSTDKSTSSSKTATSGQHLIRLTPGDNELTVTGRETDVGGADVRLDALTKGDVPIAFNAAYLRAALDACQDDNVTFNGTDALKPYTLVDGDLEQLLMPVRIDS